MSPIYNYLGADHANLPYLWLAGPITGLVLQPFVGAWSDRSVTRWGRRMPYMVLGALVCSLCLLAMPFSTALWMAVCLLWVLDAANNVAMEPYRALVSDVLAPPQRPLGYLTQSAFTGLAQTLAYLTPPLLVWMGMNQDAANAHHIPYVTIAAFVIGAGFSAGSILLTARSVREPAIAPAEIARIRQRGAGLGATVREIGSALREMPPTMRQLAPVMLFQWYAIFATGNTSCCRCRPHCSAPPTPPRMVSARPAWSMGRSAGSITSLRFWRRLRWCRWCVASVPSTRMRPA